jgi:endonuclease YncB( thermonuclease family)
MEHFGFEKWSNIDLKSVSSFSFNNRSFWCRIIKVYDGDSITGIIDFDNTFYKIAIRLVGIDACEINSTNEILRNRGTSCRKRLMNLIGYSDKTKMCMVWLTCFNNDKYGRVLANVYNSPVDNKRVQDTLLEENHVYKYNGGKRKSEKEQLSYFGILP